MLDERITITVLIIDADERITITVLIIDAG